MNKLKKIFSALLFFSFLAPASYVSGDMIQLEKLFLEGRYEKAISEADDLIGSRSRQRDEVYYLKGLSELKLQRFGEARRSFQNILDRYPGSGRAFDAYVGMGDSYILEDRASSALKEYEEASRRFPRDNNIVTVYSRMSDCYAKLGDKAKEEEYSQKSRGIKVPTIPETVTHTKDVPRGETGYISVQVGSFKNKKNAEKMVRKLSREGFEAYVEIPAGSGDKLYRVKAGRLQSLQSADALESKLKARGYATKICPDNV